MVRDIYFATEDFSEATFAIVNAGLYMLFLEVIAYESNVASKAELEACLHLCRANLETCLLHMPLFMSTKLENVQALYFGVSPLYSFDPVVAVIAVKILTSRVGALCH